MHIQVLSTHSPVAYKGPAKLRCKVEQAVENNEIENMAY